MIPQINSTVHQLMQLQENIDKYENQVTIWKADQNKIMENITNMATPEKEAEKLLNFIKENREFLQLIPIERASGIPIRTLYKVMRGDQLFPLCHVEKLKEVMVKLGYKEEAISKPRKTSSHIQQSSQPDQAH